MRIRTSIFTSVLATSLLVPAFAFGYTPADDTFLYVEQEQTPEPQNRLELLDYVDTHDYGTAESYDSSSVMVNSGAASDAVADEVVEDNSLVAGHGMQLGMAFLGVPSGVLGHWFAHHGNTWDDSVNMGFSLDYFLRFKRPCEMRFSVSWVNAKTGDAYWLEKKSDTQPQLADYIVQDYSMVNIEIAAYHVVKIIDEVAFYYGGGGWFGVTMGNARSYAIRSSCAHYGEDIQQCPHEPGSVGVEGIPPVMGFVMATVGFKFTILDVMTIRAEGGFKGYLYGQLGVGVQF